MFRHRVRKKVGSWAMFTLGAQAVVPGHHPEWCCVQTQATQDDIVYLSALVQGPHVVLRQEYRAVRNFGVGTKKKGVFTLVSSKNGTRAPSVSTG